MTLILSPRASFPSHSHFYLLERPSHSSDLRAPHFSTLPPHLSPIPYFYPSPSLPPPPFPLTLPRHLSPILLRCPPSPVLSFIRHSRAPKHGVTWPTTLFPRFPLLSSFSFPLPIPLLIILKFHHLLPSCLPSPSHSPCHVTQQFGFPKSLLRKYFNFFRTIETVAHNYCILCR